MPVSKAQIVKLFPGAKAALVDAVVSGWPTAEAAGIDRTERIAQFLANIGTETGGLKAVEENMNYSAERIRAVWPSRFKSAAQAKPYAGQPAKLANKVYGGRLGNTQPDDGWRYRGRGMMQTTGRTNYASMGFETNPEALSDPTVAFATAVREWKKRGCNALADKSDTIAIRRKINGGTHGLDQVKAYVSKARLIFANEAPAPATKSQPKESNINTMSLTLGNRGQFVVTLQEQLTTLGYWQEPHDGIFDADLKKAVESFQADHKGKDGAPLVVDGKVGIRTSTALGEALLAKETKPKIATAKRAVAPVAQASAINLESVSTAAVSATGSLGLMRQAVEEGRETSNTLMSLGPWVLLAIVVAGGGAWLLYQQYKQRQAAKAATEALDET